MPPEPPLPPPPPPAAPGPPPPIFCSRAELTHQGPIRKRMISRWTRNEPMDPARRDCLGRGIPTGGRYRGFSRDSRSIVPGVMSPNDTTDEPGKVRPSYHFTEKFVPSLLGCRLRRSADDLHPGAARLVHRENHVLIGDLGVALDED